MPVNTSESPILSPGLKEQLQGAMPDVVVVDGRNDINGIPRYGLHHRTLDEMGINNIPTLTDSDFGNHLSDTQRAKYQRRAHGFIGHLPKGKRAIEIAAAIANTKAALADERRTSELAGEQPVKRSIRRQLSTVIPHLLVEATVGDPMLHYYRMQHHKEKSDTEFIARTISAAYDTVMNGINVKPPTLLVDAVSWTSGWLSIPVDIFRAIGSLNETEEKPEAALLFPATAAADFFFPYPSPGLSSAHTRYGMNVHLLTDQAVHTDGMYKTLVENQQVGSVDREADYQIAARRLINTRGERGLKNLHSKLLGDANSVRKELGQGFWARRAKRDELLSDTELAAYRSHALTPEAHLDFLRYTMGTQIESAVKAYRDQQTHLQVIK